jgi:hypothetical protein
MMGGKHETRISGLRMHISETVHIHDDARTLKFEAATQDFKEDIEEGLEELVDDDGVYTIQGFTPFPKLYLIKEGRNLSMVLGEKGSVRKELKRFTKKIK